jgi:hypothetical protein
MTPDLSRLRARVLWLLAKVQLRDGVTEAMLTERSVLAALELPAFGQEWDAALGNLPSGVSVERIADSVRIRVALNEGAEMMIARYWRDKTGRDHRTEFTQKRLSLIRARLAAGHSPADLCRAIDACSQSAWHNGENPSGVRYNDTQHIFTPERLERWLSIRPQAAAGNPQSDAEQQTLLRRQSGRLGR